MTQLASRAWVLVCAVLLTAGWAEATPVRQSSDGGPPIVTVPLLSGGLDQYLGLGSLGIRTRLFFNHLQGVSFRGGLDRGVLHRPSGSLDLFFQGQAREMGLGFEGQFLLQLKGSYGRNVNPGVGALSDPFDDADFSEPIYVNAFWYQRHLWWDQIQLRLGYLNQAAFLDRNRYANSEDRQFMSTFLDNNGIVPLKIALGLTVFVHPAPWLTFVVAAADADNPALQVGFDTTFDNLRSLMLHFEADLRQSSPLEGNYRFGLFRDPRRKTFFERGPNGQPEESGDFGFYLSFDQLLFREAGSQEQGLGVFQRYGYRDSRSNRIAHFWSVGIQYQGLLPGRGRDVLGMGMYSAHSSAAFRSLVNPQAHREMGFELYYRIPLTRFIDLTPDLQFIDNPGGERGVGDALIFGIRVRADL